MCSVFSDALILVSSFFFQFDHKNTHTNIYECKKRSNYCISVSQKKKKKLVANGLYSLNVIVHEADMITANYDGSRQWREKPNYQQM